MTDRDLKIAIAHAKWSVQYDIKQITETAQWDGGIGTLESIVNSISNGWIGRSKIDPQTAADEIRTFRKSANLLLQLAKEAVSQGIDPSRIPARSNSDYLGDL
ncbi:MAG: hypothetical protein SGJ04_09850 [Bacteroidota bacterium]|nr:hypothetical protein [Bacteroidota bacterium]